MPSFGPSQQIAVVEMGKAGTLSEVAHGEICIVGCIGSVTCRGA